MKHIHICRNNYAGGTEYRMLVTRGPITGLVVAAILAVVGLLAVYFWI